MHKENSLNVGETDQSSLRLYYESPRLQFIHLPKPLSLLEEASTPATFEEISEGGEINGPDLNLDK